MQTEEWKKQANIHLLMILIDFRRTSPQILIVPSPAGDDPNLILEERL